MLLSHQPDRVSTRLHNLTDLLRVFYLPPKREKQIVKHLFSASQLVEAGVKLHVGQDYQPKCTRVKICEGRLLYERLKILCWTKLVKVYACRHHNCDKAQKSVELAKKFGIKTW